MTIPGPAPKYGAHSEQILGRLGYDPEEITQLIKDGIVGLKWSDKYLPE